MQSLTIYHLLSTVRREIRSQEIPLQRHLDINIHVWSKLTGYECRKSPQSLSVFQKHSTSPPSSFLQFIISCMYLLALICVWVEGVLMRVLGVPPLTGDTWRCLVDFASVILPAAAETVSGETRALAFLHAHLSWREGARWKGNELAFIGHLWTSQRRGWLMWLILMWAGLLDTEGRRGICGFNCWFCDLWSVSAVKFKSKINDKIGRMCLR